MYSPAPEIETVCSVASPESSALSAPEPFTRKRRGLDALERASSCRRWRRAQLRRLEGWSAVKLDGARQHDRVERAIGHGDARDAAAAAAADQGAHQRRLSRARSSACRPRRPRRCASRLAEFRRSRARSRPGAGLPRLRRSPPAGEKATASCSVTVASAPPMPVPRPSVIQVRRSATRTTADDEDGQNVAGHGRLLGARRWD